MQFELVRQISIALENHPGALHRAVAELARHGINIQGISVLDSLDQGVIRLRTDQPGRTRELLERVGLNVIEADVFEFDLPDAPGQLAAVCLALAQGDVNIDYAYGTSHGTKSRMRVLLRASPIERAREVLTTLQVE